MRVIHNMVIREKPPSKRPRIRSKPKDETYVHEKKNNQLFSKVKLPYVPIH